MVKRFVRSCVYVFENSLDIVKDSTVPEICNNSWCYMPSTGAVVKVTQMLSPLLTGSFMSLLSYTPFYEVAY
jgi:hypothetical protein